MRLQADGFGTQCKACVLRYREANRDHIRESGKRYWAANRERKRAKARRDYQRHKDQYRQRAKRWYAANRSQARENVKRYQAEHAEYYQSLATSRKRGMRSPDAADREFAQILKGDPCSYCGGVCEEIDHIDPVKAGGENWWGNLTAACLACNRAKSTKPLLIAVLENGGTRNGDDERK